MLCAMKWKCQWVYITKTHSVREITILEKINDDIENCTIRDTQM